MKVARVRISNILGIDELEFEAGAFNVISGVNGSSKTSVIEAIKSIIPGTKDATLLRLGADRGEVVLVLDDGTEIKRRVGVGRGVTVTRDGVNDPKAADYLKSYIDALSVNPVAFLSADPKDRVNVLLESLPMQADMGRLEVIAGDAASAAREGAHALEQIAAVSKQIYDDRTLTNRAIKEKEATINQLSATVPKTAAGTPVGSISELEEKLAAADAVRDAEMGRIATKLDGMRAEHAKKVAGYQTTIDELKALISDANANLAEMERKAGQQRELKNREFSNIRQPISDAIAGVRANAEASMAAELTRKTMIEMRAAVDLLQEDAIGMTTAIDALQAYKAELLAALPIPGLEVRDGEVYREGVIFDRLNKAQQVEIAVEIAKLRAGELGLICVDDLESLDTEHFNAFREKALESNLQLFVTRVTDDAFAVSAEG